MVRGRDGRIVRLAQGEELGPDELEPAGEAPEVAALAYCVRRAAFRPALRRLSPDPADGEYRLAGIVEVLVRAGYTVGSVETGGLEEIAEVDDRVHLAEVEATIRRRINLGWLASGVTMVDPATVYVDATVALARDVTIFPNTLLQGRTAVGRAPRSVPTPASSTAWSVPVPGWRRPSGATPRSGRRPRGPLRGARAGGPGGAELGGRRRSPPSMTPPPRPRRRPPPTPPLTRRWPPPPTARSDSTPDSTPDS